MAVYDPKIIESKWQKRWRDEHLFAADDSSSKQKMYVLDMFPYPSGDGLHVGHVKGYIATDVYARFKLMQGYEVLHPMGWDAFGLPAENYALANKVHPRAAVERNITRFKEQMLRVGFTYDWSREINTTDPAYYKWTQWIFLQLFKKGLAYQSDELINWCPSCKTGLANEDIEDGRCERCGTLVEKKRLRQWVLRITAYAEQLLADLGKLTWPEPIKELQRNWIGRSEGALIKFKIQSARRTTTAQNSQDAFVVDVFTTRADTLFGATYLVLAPEHTVVHGLLTWGLAKNADEITVYVDETMHKTDLMRQEEAKEKTGVELKGVAAVNPATGEEISVWVADYVLMSYGTGAIMAVPAHDKRDFAFAQKFALPVRRVIQSTAGVEDELPYVGYGVLVDSKEFTGMSSEQAKYAITTKVNGGVTTMYKLRDWVFSRQRYWGEPIPIIHCKNCGTVPVPEEDLPVVLPEVEYYEPTGTGESPLAAIETWVNVKCPACGGPGRRETNTMPQWAGSSWYYLRYIDSKNDRHLINPDKERYWMPVDMYAGGAEHATRHLIYARFWHKFLCDIGVVTTTEPFRQLQNVGLVSGEDGRKMSKRWGNVISPDDVIRRFGADTLRVYEMFMGPFNAGATWSTSSILGPHRFLQRIWVLVQNKGLNAQYSQVADDGVRVVMHRTIKRVTDGIEQFRFNTAIAALMELLNDLERQETVSRDSMRDYVLLLAPFAPHVAEELWAMLGNESSLIRHPWPQHDPGVLARAAISISVQVNGTARGELEVAPDSSQEEVEVAARKLPRVAKYLEEGSVERVVYVSGRMMNFVTRHS